MSYSPFFNSLSRKLRNLVAASAVAAVPAMATAADEPAKPNPEHAALFYKLDANNDGQVSKDEVPEEQRRLLERLIANHDKNEDGKLSAAELSAGLSEERPRGDGPPPGGPGGPRRPDGGQFNPEEFFRRLDKNGDGKVSPDEMPEDRREQFKQMLSRVDENKDGAASAEEFKRGFGGPRPDGQPGQPGQPGRPGEPGRPGMPQGGGDPLVRAIDTDRNGELSADEIAGASAALKKLDKNGDGKVTREEVGPPPGPPQPGQPGRPGEGFRPNPDQALAYFKQQDKDGDGKLSKDEVGDRMRENFDRIDGNSDGKLDDTELKQMVARMQSAGGPPGRRPEGARPEGDRKPEGDRRPDADRKPEGDRKPDARPEGDRKPDGDKKPEGDRKPEKKDDGAPRKE